MARRIMLSAMCLLVLAGCRSEVISTIAVEPDATAQLTATVVLHDELADTADEAALIAVVAARTGVQPDTVEVERTTTTLTASVDLPLDALLQSAPVTGVSAVTATRNDDQLTVAVDVVIPEDLLVAVVDAAIAAGRDAADADSLATAAAGTTDIVVVVSFPGDVVSAEFQSASGLSSSVTAPTSQSVELRQPLSQMQPGRLLVTGELAAPAAGLPTYLIGVAALAGVGIAAAVAYDRRRRN